ncbi:MAG: FHA domain-containing protein, partial [Jatrophihabitans sp.]
DGGDGMALAQRLDAVLDGVAFSAVAFGPTKDAVAVTVYGHAWADVATDNGEQRLALKQPSGTAHSAIPGTLSSIRAGLGDVDVAADPPRWGGLDAGVVPARGLLFLPAAVADAAAASTPAAAPVAPAAPPASDVPTVPPPTSASPRRPAPGSAEPMLDPLSAPAPGAVQATPAPAPPQAQAPVTPAPAEVPPAPEIADFDRDQPFSSVVFVQAAAATLPEPEIRAPLPVVDAPLAAPAPNVAPAAHPVPDAGVKVLGVYCKNGHFDDPSARYCAICGISMAQLTLIPRPGPRPPLGVLVLDDGAIFSLDTDYVIGRSPDRFESVTSGAARPLRLSDRQGLLSRAHLLIRLDGWQVQVVDLGSANGTGVLAPGAAAWQRVAAQTPVTIRPGTEVGFGQRRLRYESHRNT